MQAAEARSDPLVAHRARVFTELYTRIAERDGDDAADLMARGGRDGMNRATLAIDDAGRRRNIEAAEALDPEIGRGVRLLNGDPMVLAALAFRHRRQLQRAGEPVTLVGRPAPLSAGFSSAPEPEEVWHGAAATASAWGSAQPGHSGQQVGGLPPLPRAAWAPAEGGPPF